MTPKSDLMFTPISVFRNFIVSDPEIELRVRIRVRVKVRVRVRARVRLER